MKGHMTFAKAQVLKRYTLDIKDDITPRECLEMSILLMNLFHGVNYNDEIKIVLAMENEPPELCKKHLKEKT